MKHIQINNPRSGPAASEHWLQHLCSLVWNDIKTLAAGFCQAAVHILRKPGKRMHTRLFGMLMSFLPCLTPRNAPAAMAVLVPGGIVELTMGHMGEAGQNELMAGLTLFKNLSEDPGARERLCMPGMVDQLASWIAKWLREVRATTGRQSVVCLLLRMLTCAAIVRFLDHGFPANFSFSCC